MMSFSSPVIPANAGTQSGKHCPVRPWVPAFAGMTIDFEVLTDG
jgi:hypothetical protein